MSNLKEFFLKVDLNDQLKFKLELDQNGTSLFDSIYQEISSRFNLNTNDFYLVTNRGTKLNAKSSILSGDTFQICPYVLGGKGGFGSLLRAFGKQITMSTNKEACRDLTGRRIRHVNQEKKLKEFLENQQELEKQKAQKKQEKLERRKRKREKLESTHHLFLDPNYDKQKQKIAEDLDEAITKATTEQRKRKLISSNDEEIPTTSTNVEKAEKVFPKINHDSNIESNKNDEVESNIEIQASVKSTLSLTTTAKLEVKKSEIVEKKNNVPTAALTKDWLGCGDLDVSSSSDDEDKDEPPKKSLKK